MVRRHEFGPEGHAYVRRYLESGTDFGKRLGGLLLEQHDVERGLVWAFVRVDSPAEKLVEFETGGLFPKFDPDWKEEADAWLRERLGGGTRQRVLLVEHPYAKATDGWLQKGPDRSVVFCGDDVYEYYSAEAGELVGWLGGATWGPYIGVIAPAPEDAGDGRSPHDLGLRESKIVRPTRLKDSNCPGSGVQEHHKAGHLREVAGGMCPSADEGSAPPGLIEDRSSRSAKHPSVSARSAPGPAG